MDHEKTLEPALREGVKKRGGLALKFVSPSMTGVPDRIVLFPGGKIYFIELKTEGKKLSPRQEIVRTILERLGFKYFVIDTREKLNGFLRIC